jgi:hypothetical protein
MRHMLLIVSVLLGGCAAHERFTAHECAIYNFSGDLTDGLVGLDEELKLESQAQLPAEVRSLPFCWYQLSSGNLEAQLSDIGYEFERKQEQWHFVKKNEYIVLVHKRRR